MQLYKYCLRCGRRLKTETARLRGYGTICAEKAKQEGRLKRLIPTEKR